MPQHVVVQGTVGGFTGQFPSREHVGQCRIERLIYLWIVYGECENNVMGGHTGQPCSCASTIQRDTLPPARTGWWGVFDTVTGERIKRMKGHTSFVNSVDCEVREALWWCLVETIVR